MIVRLTGSVGFILLAVGMGMVHVGLSVAVVGVWFLGLSWALHAAGKP